MKITKRELWIIGGAVVLVVVAVVIGYAVRGNGGANSEPAQSSDLAPAPIVAPTSSTVAPVPANAVAPNKGATTTSSNVAVPTVQSAGNPAGTTSYRSFNISIANNTYTPNTVIVKQGDTVNLKMTAVDATYAFTQPAFGFNTPIAKGKTQTIQFQAVQSGDFTFYCQSCGGPSKGPVGHLIVTAK